MNVVQELQRPVSALSGSGVGDGRDLIEELAKFNHFGKQTRKEYLTANGFGKIPVFINEFWTAKQRAACSLHEVSYRACFKPQLPRFFIERLTSPDEVVYDPFMGRGTTLIEAALLGRTPHGCDINPLSQIFVRSRLNPPKLGQIEARLKQINFKNADEQPEKLLAFYHSITLKEICALKKYLLDRKSGGGLDGIDDWIWMVAANRLTGHSPGFFSVYTLPPNQAVSVESQIKINHKRRQTPPRRHVSELILRKSRQLLRDLDEFHRQQLTTSASNSLLVTCSAHEASEIRSDSVALVVTSPPFLDIVDYEKDNWLRAWFCGVDVSKVAIWHIKNLNEWEIAMNSALSEIRRVLRPGGWVAFEVGEVRNGEVKLENAAMKAGIEAGLRPVLILINNQAFTKTSNCWGIDNLKKGTNTNRIVLFQKEG